MLSDESEATPWVHALLERLGLSASAATEVVIAAALTTTGALRTLRNKPAEWEAFLDQLGPRSVASAYPPPNVSTPRPRKLFRGSALSPNLNPSVGGSGGRSSHSIVF